VKLCQSKFCNCAYFVSAALSRKITRLAEKNWATSGLSPSIGYLLLAVLEDPGIQPGMLGQQLQLAPSTITRLIEKLEQKKLIIRANDGKLIYVYPTPKGKKLYMQLNNCRQAFSEEFDRLMGDEGTRKLLQDMQVVAERLEG
jgi:DNA-binding MarR family transcriptional regulator